MRVRTNSKGRAEPAILLLEDAGVSYDFKRYDITSPQKPFQNYMPDGTFPSQACPVLTDGDFSVAQTPAIMNYLGHKHGWVLHLLQKLLLLLLWIVCVAMYRKALRTKQIVCRWR